MRLLRVLIAVAVNGTLVSCGKVRRGLRAIRGRPVRPGRKAIPVYPASAFASFARIAMRRIAACNAPRTNCC